MLHYIICGDCYRRLDRRTVSSVLQASTVLVVS
jgi:hypothetical protein